MKITHTAPISLRFSEIDNYLALIGQNYGQLSFTEFYNSPGYFGGTARFIQMIAKHAIEIASQVAFDNGLQWSNYPDLFAKLSSGNVIDAETSTALLKLSDYYLPATLLRLKLKDVYETRQTVSGLIKSYQHQLAALPGAQP